MWRSFKLVFAVNTGLPSVMGTPFPQPLSLPSFRGRAAAGRDGYDGERFILVRMWGQGGGGGFAFRFHSDWPQGGARNLGIPPGAGRVCVPGLGFTQLGAPPYPVPHPLP